MALMGPVPTTPGSPGGDYTDATPLPGLKPSAGHAITPHAVRHPAPVPPPGRRKPIARLMGKKGRMR